MHTEGRMRGYGVHARPSNSGHRSMTLELTQREHRITEFLQLFATAQIGQVDNEGAADHRSARHADQSKRRFGRAASGNQVVDEQYALGALNRIAVHFQSVGAILELIVVTEVFG